MHAPAMHVPPGHAPPVAGACAHAPLAQLSVVQGLPSSHEGAPACTEHVPPPQ
jgi:hypothetical protein